MVTAALSAFFQNKNVSCRFKQLWTVDISFNLYVCCPRSSINVHYIYLFGIKLFFIARSVIARMSTLNCTEYSYLLVPIDIGERGKGEARIVLDKSTRKSTSRLVRNLGIKICCDESLINGSTLRLHDAHDPWNICALIAVFSRTMTIVLSSANGIYYVGISARIIF